MGQGSLHALTVIVNRGIWNSPFKGQDPPPPENENFLTP